MWICVSVLEVLWPCLCPLQVVVAVVGVSRLVSGILLRAFLLLRFRWRKVVAAVLVARKSLGVERRGRPAMVHVGSEGWLT